MWDGIERRKASRMDKELQDIKIEFASFTATVTEWMSSTKTYRTELCLKFDKLDNKIDCLPQTLPCKTQDERIRNIEQKVARVEGKATMLGAIAGFITYLIGKALGK